LTEANVQDKMILYIRYNPRETKNTPNYFKLHRNETPNLVNQPFLSEE